MTVKELIIKLLEEDMDTEVQFILKRQRRRNGMTVKELIIKLLEEDMDTEVQLTIDAPHQNEHGDCEGYVFDIDSVSHEFGECLIKFTDWREGE